VPAFVQVCSGSGYGVLCRRCHLTVDSRAATEAEAATVWNARAPSAPPDDAVREAVAKALLIEPEYSIRLVRLVDGVSTYATTFNGGEHLEFPSHAEALAYVCEQRSLLRADAVLAALATTVAQDQKELPEATMHVCHYPVLQRAGRCCGVNPCGVTWERPCDAQGGCIDRSTCGGCEEPVFPKIAAPEEDQ
jgi:hypothetical protein